MNQKKLSLEYDSKNGVIKVFHSPLWTMEYDIALGGLKEYMNRATYIAQLAKSRSGRQNFKGISNEEAVNRIDKIDKIYSDWKDEGMNDKNIAYLIYERLKNKKASKAVTAQWFSKLLFENKTEVIPLLKQDEQIKYLCKAIFHVTKS